VKSRGRCDVIETYGISATPRSSCRCTSSRRESGAQVICGRRGTGRKACIGRSSVSPYDQYCTPSVVRRTLSPPPALRTYTSYVTTKASHCLSGERTNGVFA